MFGAFVPSSESVSASAARKGKGLREELRHAEVPFHDNAHRASFAGSPVGARTLRYGGVLQVDVVRVKVSAESRNYCCPVDRLSVLQMAGPVGGLLRGSIERSEARTRCPLQLIGVQWTHRSPCEAECGVDGGHNLSSGSSPSGSRRSMLLTENPCVELYMAIVLSETRPNRIHIETPRSSKMMAGIELLPSRCPPRTTDGSRRHTPALNPNSNRPRVIPLNCKTPRSLSSTGN